MYELPRCRAERPHIDLERIVQAAVRESQVIEKKLFRDSDPDKKKWEMWAYVRTSGAYGKHGTVFKTACR